MVLLSGHRRARSACPDRSRSDAGRALVCRRTPESRREPAARGRRSGFGRDRLLGRGQGTAPRLARAVAPPGRRHRSGTARAGCGSRRLRRGVHAEHARDAGRDAGRREPWCRLHVDLARFRHPGCPRPFRADTPEGPVRGGRLLVRRQAHRLRRQSRGHRGAAARSRARGAGAVPRDLADDDGHSAREAARRVPWPPFSHRADRVRAPTVRSPGLRALLLGHDGCAEGHRPWCRWHAAAASQGTAAPLRRPARRSVLLLHDLRLDDVEHSRLGPRLRRNAPDVRRLALRRWRPDTLPSWPRRSG